MFDRKTSSKSDNKHTPGTKIDHSHIMNKFYEQEMPELTKASTAHLDHKAFDQSLEDADDDLESFRTAAASKNNTRRRDLKMTPEDKAKERLW